MNETVVTFPGLIPEESEGNPEERQKQRLALLEAIIYGAEDPPTNAHLAAGLGVPEEILAADIELLLESYKSEARGIEIRAVGGGYRMFTKPEHHEAVRAFAKTMKPRLRLSMAALETLAIVAYRQPVTTPEIQAIRGKASAGGVIHTLLRHRLIATAGRKKVIGRPMRYKTTDEFLIHFGLNDLSELPTLKEMEDLDRSLAGEAIQVVDEAESDPASPPETPETE